MSTSATVVRETTGRIVGLAWHRFPPDLAADVRPLFGPAQRADMAQNEPCDFIVPAATTGPAVQIEREAYARGFADGERQATAAAAARHDAAADRLLKAARDLQQLRTGFLARSENDVLVLALAIARRVLGEAIDLDRARMVRMARLAVERLGGDVLATIQMRPDDLEALPAQEIAGFANGPLRLEAVSHLPAGACTVQTPCGAIDLSLDAQLKEMLDGLAANDQRD